MSTPITRREAVGIGLGAVAGAIVGRDIEPLFAATSSPELETALKAARWLNASRIETPNGVTWPNDPNIPHRQGTDLYHGFPGVVLFHLELYHATREQRWLDEARLGANELVARLPAMNTVGNAGLYTGLAGAAWVLEETHRATADGRYRDAATNAVEMIHTHAKLDGDGAVWKNDVNDIIGGSAGIGLFLLWAEREMGHSKSRQLAVAAGRRLLSQGQPAAGGQKWYAAPGGRNLYPNFSHGTAGVGYFLASLYRASGDRAFLEGALAGARYLESVANTDGGGFRVFHHEPGGEQLFYLSWCHGPPGSSRFFYELAQATQDDRWLAPVRRGAQSIIDSGIPEKRTPGFWNNISQCCGNCGVGEHFLALQDALPAASYAATVKCIADDTLQRATAAGDGLKWIQAEHRVSPEDVKAQTGFMQGAAGVGTFFLHLDASRSRKRSPIVWPDSPFSRTTSRG